MSTLKAFSEQEHAYDRYQARQNSCASKAAFKAACGRPKRHLKSEAPR